VRRILIDERDQYLAFKIRTAPGRKIVAAVGAGHVPGIHTYWSAPVDIELLEQMPPKGRLFSVLKWVIPAGIIGLLAAGFFGYGAAAAANMVTWWALANAFWLPLGQRLPLAHPLTILIAGVAAPLTSLNPMMAAGWVAGLAEAFLSKPKVRDFRESSRRHHQRQGLLAQQDHPDPHGRGLHQPGKLCGDLHRHTPYGQGAFVIPRESIYPLTFLRSSVSSKVYLLGHWSF
jgi:pheromone shutdown protein TraB